MGTDRRLWGDDVGHQSNMAANMPKCVPRQARPVNPAIFWALPTPSVTVFRQSRRNGVALMRIGMLPKTQTVCHRSSHG